jgi:lipopolysaccharide/colanic/teichoic acid biosynthesis glycosyltransferase
LTAAAFSPLLALYLRDDAIIAHNTAVATLYWLFSVLCTLTAFWALGIEARVPRYFSLSDALNLAKAVVIGELLTAIGLFSFTRLEGIPRSVPAIHALLLGAGLIAARVIVKLSDSRSQTSLSAPPISKQNIIMIGLNDLSALFIKFLETAASSRWKVIALLDDDPRLTGRLVHGIRVLGPPTHLAKLIDEFTVHGVRTDRVMLAAHHDNLTLRQITRACEHHAVDVAILPDVFSEGSWGSAGAPAPQRHAASSPETVSRYFWYKARIELPIALVLLISLSPLFLVASVLALIDVGFPVIFWQRRIGLQGREFLIYKLRTLKFAFDGEGRRLPEEDRLSRIGRLLRRLRLDEFPQLFSVIIGDMSLIGPRPLLPQDQPLDPTVRLSVRPGLTGWAQVNGATLLSAEEKEPLDAWYVRNASPWLDLKIIGLTLRFLVLGERRRESVSRRARLGRHTLRFAWRAPAPDQGPSLREEDGSTG